jgi:hypothetical protein
MNRKARSAVPGLRQETQFTCCATSIAACLQAHGKNQTEADVNMVLGASPMAGATWEAVLATVQYFGLRGTLVVPATVSMLKAWTDAGTPVIIAWNPENRPWSHASVVADVTDGPDGRYVHIMDSNIPNPDKTFRVLHEDDFCAKWGEKVNDSLIVRRPACAVEREITVEGRQVRASTRGRNDRSALIHLAAKLPQGDSTRRAIVAGLLSRDKQLGVHPFRKELADIAFVVKNPGSLISLNPLFPEKSGDVAMTIAQLDQIYDRLKNLDASGVKAALLRTPRSMWMNVPASVFRFSGVKARHLNLDISDQELLSFA